MSDELERLKRLRDRQLADRDPKTKQKRFQRTYTQRERKARGERYTLGDAWRTVPHIYRSPLIGILIGVGVIVFLPLVWKSVWAIWVGVIVTFFLIIVGVAVGQALDVRDNLRDFSKH